MKGVLTGLMFGWTALAGAGELTIASEQIVPAIMVADGKVTGFAADQLAETMRRAGVPYKIAIYPWQRAYTMATTQAATCVFPTTRTREREAQFKWVGPVFDSDWVLYGDPTRHWNLRTLEDARKLRIGSYIGDVRGDYLRERGFMVDTVSHDSYNPQKLVLGRIDVWVSSPRVARQTLEKVKLSDRIVPLLTFHQSTLYLACNRAVPDVVIGKMSAALEAARKEGTLKAIEKRYDNWAPPASQRR